jgi:integrase
MRWALGQGIIAHDPTFGMKKPIKKEAVRDRELSPAEIATFWRNVDQLPTTPALRIAMKLSLVTAQRIGEVCGIAKSELVLDGPAPVWMLPRERAKNSEGHRVPLSRSFARRWHCTSRRMESPKAHGSSLREPSATAATDPSRATPPLLPCFAVVTSWVCHTFAYTTCGEPLPRAWPRWASTRTRSAWC